MLFNLDFANNTILTCFFFFLIIDLIFNPIAALVILTGILSKKVKAEVEIHPVIVEAKIGKCSI